MRHGRAWAWGERKGAGVRASSFSAVVLAGGKSSRLGTDKALLCVDGEPLISWLPARLAGWFADVVVVVDRPGRYDVPWRQVVDAVPDAGPLAGIAAGLAAISTPAAFVCACDMPLLRPALLGLLCAALGEGIDVAIPERDGRLEPLCAIYRATCLPTARDLLSAGKRRANGLAEALPRRVLTEPEWRAVDPEADSFRSINTPDELSALTERARAHGLRITR